MNVNTVGEVSAISCRRFYPGNPGDSGKCRHVGNKTQSGKTQKSADTADTPIRTPKNWRKSGIKGVGKVCADSCRRLPTVEPSNQGADMSSEVIDGWSVRSIQPSDVKLRSGVVRVPITREVRAVVWAKTKGLCWYCGKETNPFDDFTVDHVVPRARGGADDIDNLVPACRTCNSRKQAKPIDEMRSNGPVWSDQALAGERMPVGCRVRHRQFGSGVVVTEDAVEGAHASIVRFENGSRCRRIVNAYLRKEGGKS